MGQFPYINDLIIFSKQIIMSNAWLTTFKSTPNTKLSDFPPKTSNYPNEQEVGGQGVAPGGGGGAGRGAPGHMHIRQLTRSHGPEITFYF